MCRSTSNLSDKCSSPRQDCSSRRYQAAPHARQQRSSRGLAPGRGSAPGGLTCRVVTVTASFPSPSARNQSSPKYGLSVRSMACEICCSVRSMASEVCCSVVQPDVPSKRLQLLTGGCGTTRNGSIPKQTVPFSGRSRVVALMLGDHFAERSSRNCRERRGRFIRISMNGEEGR
jgi:hypothetical protein